MQRRDQQSCSNSNKKLLTSLQEHDMYRLYHNIRELDVLYQYNLRWVTHTIIKALEIWLNYRINSLLDFDTILPAIAPKWKTVTYHTNMCSTVGDWVKLTVRVHYNSQNVKYMYPELLINFMLQNPSHYIWNLFNQIYKMIIIPKNII